MQYLMLHFKQTTQDLLSRIQDTTSYDTLLANTNLQQGDGLISVLRGVRDLEIKRIQCVNNAGQLQGGLPPPRAASLQATSRIANLASNSINLSDDENAGMDFEDTFVVAPVDITAGKRCMYHLMALYLLLTL